MCHFFIPSLYVTKVEITTNSPQLKFRKLWPPADPTELEKVRSFVVGMMLSAPPAESCVDID